MARKGSTIKNRNDDAIGTAEFEALMGGIGLDGLSPPDVDRPPAGLAVGVSGGPDSMALGLLASNWAKTRNRDAVALIVDHGLRPESGTEARQVAEWLAARGMRAEILHWRGVKPVSGVQAAARAARYGLMTEWCEAHEIDQLLLAHHRDDQAETFLMRLSHGSGIDGLAGMAPVSRPHVAKQTSVRVYRPLLAVPKTRLIATLEDWGVPWVEDPSNQSSEFARVRMRRALRDLAQEGLTSDRLSLAAKRLARAGAALDATTDDLIARAVRQDPAGYCEIDLADFRRAPDEIALRALIAMLRWAGGPADEVRLQRAERLYAALIDTDDFSGRTLGGCQVQIIKRGRTPKLMVYREVEAAGHRLVLRPGGRGCWDGRFRVALAPATESLPPKSAAAPPPEVRCLGESGWRQISAYISDTVRARVPASVRPSLPALWDQEGVAAVPLVGYERRGSASVFGAFSTDVRSFDERRQDRRRAARMCS